MNRKQKHLPVPPDLLLTDAEVNALVKQFMTKVGARIREFRTMQGLTLAYLRDNSGLNVSQTSRIENGKQNLTLWTAVRFAYVLGVRPWDFYVPRERAPSIRPKRRKRPPPTKPMLQEATVEFRQQVARRIRSLCKLQGISRAGLHEFSGVGLPTLLMIDAATANIRASTAVRIADAIGVHTYELYIPSELSGIQNKQIP